MLRQGGEVGVDLRAHPRGLLVDAAPEVGIVARPSHIVDEVRGRLAQRHPGLDKNRDSRKCLRPGGYRPQVRLHAGRRDDLVPAPSNHLRGSVHRASLPHVESPTARRPGRGSGRGQDPAGDEAGEDPVG